MEDREIAEVELEPAFGKQSRPEGGHKTAALVATIVIIEFISGFTQGYYEPLIPKFGELLGVDASGLQLFNVVPTAVAALFVPVLTRLGDIKGYRKLLRVVIPVVFIATVMILAGVVVESWALVLVGRLLNGPIACWLPLHIALVYSRTEGEDSTRAVSGIIASMTVGTVVGTASSGFAFGALGALAPAVAIIPALQLVAVLLVVFVMPEYQANAHPHIDVKGFVLLGLVMLLAILGFVEVVEGGIDSVVGALLIAAAIGVGVAWYRYEKRTDHPAVDVRVLLSKSLFPLYAGAICYGAVFYGYMSPVATYLAADPSASGYGYAFEPSGISVVQTLILLFTVVAALALPAVLKKLPPKPTLLLGFALAFASFAQWALPGSGLVKLGLLIALAGLGFGLISAAIPVIIPMRAPAHERGIATGLFNSAQTLGGALGGGLFVSLLKVGAGAGGTITATGYEVVWVTCAVFMALGFILVAVFLTRENKGIEAESEDVR
ncbi:MAG: MFS transporter [Coriobacteriaceae bacterium]|nr:MFS transporter [Coriobacteriaceae bacterium]